MKHAAYSSDTNDEVAGVFRLPEPDWQPVPRRSRTALLWDGLDWTEIDPETGEVLATGSMRG